MSRKKPIPDGIFTFDLYKPLVKIKQTEEGLDKVVDDQVAPMAQAWGWSRQTIDRTGVSPLSTDYQMEPC